MPEPRRRQSEREGVRDSERERAEPRECQHQHQRQSQHQSEGELAEPRWRQCPGRVRGANAKQILGHSLVTARNA